MTDYTEQAVLVDALRYCVGISNPCEYCPGYAEPLHCRNPGRVTIKAADMIESQFRQIEELRQDIAEKDKEPGWVTIKASGMIKSQSRQIEELRQDIAEKDKEIEDLKREIIMLQEEREAFG